MPRFPEEIGSSISQVFNKRDFGSEDHYKWVSAKNFIYFAYIYTSHILTLDLFSQPEFYQVNIFTFIVSLITIGIPYMFADVFIKLYTKRIDFNEALNPLLKGISIVGLIQTVVLNLVEAAEADNAAVYFLSSLYGATAWSRCPRDLNQTDCISPTEMIRICSKHEEHIFMSKTSAHASFISNFEKNDKMVFSTQLFIFGVLWVTNFFISTISETSILKFYKAIFWIDNVSTVFILCNLIIFSKYSKKAFADIMSIIPEDKFMKSIDMVTIIYGVGAIGVYDLGTMSPFTMVDNAILTFSVIYICFSIMRSVIVRIIYLCAEECILFDSFMYQNYVYYAVLPMSTEFLYGQKLYTTYFFMRIIMVIISRTNLCTLTVTKMLRSRFRSVKNLYLVGLLCFLGFVLSQILTVHGRLPMLMFRGSIITLVFLGAMRMVIIMWIYGVEKFSTDINFWLGFRPTKFWTFTWTIIPLILFIRCAIWLYNFLCDNAEFWDNIVIFIWFIIMLVTMSGLNIKTIVFYLMRNNVIGAFTCSKKYGPPDLGDRVLRRNYHKTIYHRQCFHDCMILDEIIDCNHLLLMNTEEISSAEASQEASLTRLFQAEPLKWTSTLHLE